MPTPLRRLAVLLAAALPLAALAANARLGFSIEAETDGMFSTTLKALHIKGVVPGSPAEAAGLKAGDDVEQANELVVAGASGFKLKSLVDGLKPGDHLMLRVKRADGEHAVDIVAGPPQ